MTQEQFNFICDLYEEGNIEINYDECSIFPSRKKELFESGDDYWPAAGKHFSRINFDNLSVYKIAPMDLISMYKSQQEEKKPKYATGFVTCDLCNHEWIAVRGSDCLKLECPKCGNITTFTTPEDEHKTI